MTAQTTLPVTANPKPQVSIGMPVYNGAKFVREALDSLLKQTFSDFELVISDNASTNDTETICREYAAKDHRIRYLRQAQNLGAVANFKCVLDEAVGEYFMWAAADDVWDPKWIATLLPISTSDQCIAFGTLQTIDSNGNPMQHPANRRNFSYTGSRVNRRLKYFSQPAFLGKANPIYGVYPRCLITPDALCVLSSEKTGSDMLFIYQLLTKAEIKSCQEVLLYKRIHEDCAGGGMRRSAGTRNLLTKMLLFVRHLVLNQYQNVKAYRTLSTPAEQFIQFLSFPAILAYSMAMQIH
jgi:glycosyltransferase involved in cell wall biosynthesis